MAINFTKTTILALSALMLAGSATASAKKKNEPVAPTPKDVYNFKRTLPTKIIVPNKTCFYTSDGMKVQNTLGALLHEGKDTVKNLSLNPSGISYSLVTRNKKGKNKAEVYSVYAQDERLGDFDAKKYGQPTAIGYTPDARNIYVAAGGKLYKLEMKKFNPVEEIEGLPFEPDAMVMSSNGYFAALSKGNKVAVINLEGKKVRKTLDFDDPVTEMVFSPDNNDFGVLTSDGIFTLYNTKNFEMRKMVDDLGEGLGCAYNFDGKYLAVATAPETVTVVNLLRDSDRETFEGAGGINDVIFLSDSENSTLMAYPVIGSVEVRRMPHLKPFYNKLVADQADALMDEWLKMQPGETMAEYQARVTDESRRRQRRLFEDEIATGFAGDLLGGQTMSLGSYDRANNVLALNFSEMNTIYVPMPESEVLAINNAGDLSLSDVQYGVMPDDGFEIVYAKVTNRPTGNSFIFDNHNRVRMDYMNSEDAVSLELLQQQQLEEMKLQELRSKIVAEAKEQNVISDHTNISVSSKVIPEYDADGNRILNYNVTFVYNVDPEFSAVEDFGPGKYHVEESGAASSMLRIVKEAFEGDLSQYVKSGKKLRVNLKGSADATPFAQRRPYDGSYGQIENEPVTCDGELTTVTVTTDTGITENEQLALLRALGVQNFLEKNVERLNDMQKDYRYSVDVAKGKGAEFRRITAEFTFVDAF